MLHDKMTFKEEWRSDILPWLQKTGRNILVGAGVLAIVVGLIADVPWASLVVAGLIWWVVGAASMWVGRGISKLYKKWVGDAV